MKPKHAWMVRAGNDNILADDVETKNAVAIGWDEMGDVSNLHSREDFKRRYEKVYPDDSFSRVAVNAGQVYRFAREIALSEYVLTYIQNSREVLIGVVDSNYEYKPDLFGQAYPHVRHIKWQKRVSRDVFSLSARNTLGSTLTVFQLDNILDEVHSIVTQEGEKPAPSDEVIETPPFYVEVKAKADELIADLISQLDPFQFQDLVAAVLIAMGFQARSVSPGRDRGVDIVAHPDAFGFEKPRIKVQVKHRKDTATGPEMRSFLGTLASTDNGLFVSTGGFTSDAMLEAERGRSHEPVKLLDRSEFIQLLLDNYEALAPEFKAQVPLLNVWLPAE